MATYVYGIVEPTASAPSGEGIAGAPLGLVPGTGAAALVSDLEADQLRFGRDEILVHARVLERALERGTVLPMRFGVVMDGSDEIRRRLLEQHGSELRTQLAELSGKVEVRIRGVYDEASLFRDVVGDEPEIAHLRQSVQGRPDDATYYERIRLGELVAAAVERRRERDSEAILDVLARAALAVEVGQPSHERVVFNASFLVAKSALTQFDEALDSLADNEGGRIRFKYTGPLPPHSFVQFTGGD